MFELAIIYNAPQNTSKKDALSSRVQISLVNSTTKVGSIIKGNQLTDFKYFSQITSLRYHGPNTTDFVFQAFVNSIFAAIKKAPISTAVVTVAPGDTNDFVYNFAFLEHLMQLTTLTIDAPVAIEAYELQETLTQFPALENLYVAQVRLKNVENTHREYFTLLRDSGILKEYNGCSLDNLFIQLGLTVVQDNPPVKKLQVKQYRREYLERKMQDLCAKADNLENTNVRITSPTQKN